MTTSNDKAFYSGPTSRLRELKFVWRVMVEFVRGFRALHFSGPCVTIFGSARFPEGHPYYVMAQKVGAAVANLGFTVMTGGGPGIMEAANRGAKEAGGLSIGCNIHLPMEQEPNPYLDKFVTMDYFFVRKVLLSKYSYAFVIMPGGFGTMDEFFEVLTLVQTGKIQDFPLIVMGQDYYSKLRGSPERHAACGDDQRGGHEVPVLHGFRRGHVRLHCVHRPEVWRDPAAVTVSDSAGVAAGAEEGEA